MNDFNHQALNLTTDKPLIFTAMSKQLFYFRMFISKFVLEQGGVPINAFMNFDYFLLDSLDRDLVRIANNNLVKRADELWVFGPISDGVLAEIIIAKELNKPIKYFKIIESKDILEIDKIAVELENEVNSFRNKL